MEKEGERNVEVDEERTDLGKMNISIYSIIRLIDRHFKQTNKQRINKTITVY